VAGGGLNSAPRGGAARAATAASPLYAACLAMAFTILLLHLEWIFIYYLSCCRVHRYGSDVTTFSCNYQFLLPSLCPCPGSSPLLPLHMLNGGGRNLPRGFACRHGLPPCRLPSLLPLAVYLSPPPGAPRLRGAAPLLLRYTCHACAPALRCILTPRRAMQRGSSSYARLAIAFTTRAYQQRAWRVRVQRSAHRSACCTLRRAFTAPHHAAHFHSTKLSPFSPAGTCRRQTRWTRRTGGRDDRSRAHRNGRRAAGESM